MSCDPSDDLACYRNERQWEGETVFNTVLDSEDVIHHVDLDQNTTESDDIEKYTPTFHTSPWENSRDIYDGPFAWTNSSDDVSDSSTIPDEVEDDNKNNEPAGLSDEIESDDDIENSEFMASSDEIEIEGSIENCNESAVLSDKELSANDRFQDTSNVAGEICSNCIGKTRRLNRQKRIRIKSKYTSLVRQMHQDRIKIWGYIKYFHRMYEDICKRVMSHMENHGNICTESSESGCSSQEPFCNDMVITELTYDEEVLQCPYIKYTLWIPRNYVFNYFERMQFVLCQFELKAEMVKRPSLNINCTLPYRRLLTLNTHTKKENIRLTYLTGRQERHDSMVKKQPFQLLHQSVKICLEQDGSAMFITKGNITLYAMSMFQLPDDRRIVVSLPMAELLQQLLCLTDRIIDQRQVHDTSTASQDTGDRSQIVIVQVILDNYIFNFKVGFGQLQKLSVLSRQAQVSIPDGMLVDHRQSTRVQSLPSDLRTLETPFVALMQMLGFAKTKTGIAFVLIEGNEIETENVSRILVHCQIKNGSRKKINLQNALQAMSISTPSPVVSNNFSNPQSNAIDDACSSMVIFPREDVESTRLKCPVIHSNINTFKGIQLPQFKTLSQVGDKRSPPFPRENNRHILSNITNATINELAEKRQNTIKDVVSLMVRGNKKPLTRVTKKSTAIRPAHARRERCLSHPNRTGTNTYMEKEMPNENSLFHAHCNKHSKLSNKEPKRNTSNLNKSCQQSEKRGRQHTLRIHRIGITSSGHLATDPDYYKTERQISGERLKENCETNFQSESFNQIPRRNNNPTEVMNYNARNVHDGRLDNEVFNGGQIGYCAESLTTSQCENDDAVAPPYIERRRAPDAGIIDSEIRLCSSALTNDVSDEYGIYDNRVIHIAPGERPVQLCSGSRNSFELGTRSGTRSLVSMHPNDRETYDNGCANRVIPIAPGERPVQMCSGSRNSFELGTRSEARSLVSMHPNDRETWKICPSGSNRENTQDNNTFRYPLGVALPASGVNSQHVHLTNTCVIDGFLGMIFVVLHFDPNLRNQLRRSTNEFDKICHKIWKNFQKHEFDKGKLIWCMYANVITQNTRTADLMGTEQEMIFSAFTKNRISIEIKCTNDECPLPVVTMQKPYDVLTLYEVYGESLDTTITNAVVKYASCPIGSCSMALSNGVICTGTRIGRVVSFPVILGINLYFLTFGEKLYSSSDIPNTVVANGEIYDLKLVRFYKNQHFTEKLFVQGDWTYYDNSDARLCYFDKDPDFSQLSSCYYIKRCRC